MDVPLLSKSVSISLTVKNKDLTLYAIRISKDFQEYFSGACWDVGNFRNLSKQSRNNFPAGAIFDE
jgi:hypothetical protein